TILAALREKLVGIVCRLYAFLLRLAGRTTQAGPVEAVDTKVGAKPASSAASQAAADASRTKPGADDDLPGTSPPDGASGADPDANAAVLAGTTSEDGATPASPVVDAGDLDEQPAVPPLSPDTSGVEAAEPRAASQAQARWETEASGEGAPV